MDNRGGVYRGLVLATDEVTGEIIVVIPSLTGVNTRVSVTALNRHAVEGTWKVPDVGSVVLVGSDDDNGSTLFLIPTFTYDDDVHAINFYGDFEGPVVFVARNDTASTIPAYTVVCGQADGGALVIAKANANDSAKPAIGITVEAIAPNASGKVAVAGVLDGPNTGSLAANINVYAGTTGNIVSTPVGLSYPQVVAKVLSVGNPGSLLVTIKDVPSTSTSGSFSGVFSGTIYATAGNIGGSASGWVIDSNRLESRGTVKKIVLDGQDGEIYIGTYGSGAYNSASTSFYVNQSGYFSLGNKLTFNPVTSTLDVNGTVTADAGNIGGWTIGASKLSAGTGSSSVALASSGGYAIYAGASTPGAATFKVSDTGYLTASGVDLSGKLVATSGSIGGWSITASSISSSGSTPIILDSSGKITVGNPNWANTANGFYVDNTGKFGLGSKLTWDNTSLLIDGTITAASGTIGGWSIDNHQLYAGTGSNFIALSSDDLVEYRTWAGHPTPSSAPFAVTNGGGLIASNASITGRIVATSGSFTGSITSASISGTSITGGSISGGYITGGSIAGNSITGSSISGATITGGSISGGYITAGSFSGGSISGGVITGGSITGGTISGASISAGSLTGASISGGQISIGASFSVDNAGNLTASNASITGNVNATSGSFSGTVTATTGSIGGFAIGATSLTSGTGSSTVGIQSSGTYPFFAGSSNASFNGSPYSVRYDGYVTASSISVLNFYNTNGSPGVLQGQLSIDGGKLSLGRQLPTAGCPSGNPAWSGLYLNATIGTTNASAWDNYWLNTGEFHAGGPDNYIDFSPSASVFTVKGTIVSTSGAIGGWVLGANTLTGISGNSNFGLASNASPHYVYAGRDVYLKLTRASNSVSWTADYAALRFAGDIEFVVRAAADDWTVGSAVPRLISKFTTGASNFGYELYINGSGNLSLQWGTSASSALIATSNVNVPFGDKSTYWLKATLDVDNGAGGNTVSFYYALDSVTEPTSWTPIYSSIRSGVTSVYTGHSSVDLLVGGRGSRAGGTFSTIFEGRIYRAIIRNGIGGSTVYDSNFSTQSTGATSFTESAAGATVTLLSGASITYTDYKFKIRNGGEVEASQFSLVNAVGDVIGKFGAISSPGYTSTSSTLGDLFYTYDTGLLMPSAASSTWNAGGLGWGQVDSESKNHVTALLSYNSTSSSTSPARLAAVSVFGSTSASADGNAVYIDSGKFQTNASSLGYSYLSMNTRSPSPSYVPADKLGATNGPWPVIWLLTEYTTSSGANVQYYKGGYKTDRGDPSIYAETSASASGTHTGSSYSSLTWGNPSTMTWVTSSGLSSQWTIGPWAINPTVFVGITNTESSLPVGATAGYVLLHAKDGTATYVSTHSSAGSVIIRPANNGTSGQATFASHATTLSASAVNLSPITNLQLNSRNAYVMVASTRVEQSASQTVTTTPTAATGLTYTASLLANDIVIIQGQAAWNVSTTASATATASATLQVGGVDIASMSSGTVDINRIADRKSTPCNARYVVPSDGSYTFTMSLSKSVNLGTVATFSGGTSMVVQVFATK